jgi:hypothetical protein
MPLSGFRFGGFHVKAAPELLRPIRRIAAPKEEFLSRVWEMPYKEMP